MRRDVIPCVDPAYTWHAVRKVDPWTDQTRPCRHRQTHLAYNDEQGEHHTTTGRVSHQDDGSGENRLMSAGRWVDKVEVRS
jgi:hypothetical protein